MSENSSKSGELLELSVVPVPANERTRTTTAKSIDDDRDVPSLEDLRARERALGLDPEADRMRREARDFIRGLMEHTTSTNGNGNDDTKTLTHAALRAKADRTAREHARVRVETFEC